MRSAVLTLLAAILSVFCSAQVPSTNPKNGVVPGIFNMAGGSYDNASSYYRFEWSIGELILVQSFAPPDSSVLLTQGVLQPCTDKVGRSAFTVLFESGDYRIFPNPTDGKFELNFFVRAIGRMNLQLIDATGRLLETRSYDYNGCCRIELFDLTRYPDGLYYVVAELTPNANRPGDNLQIIRRSGLKVIKLNK